MKNITVLISSFLVRGQRWQLAVLVALFLVTGCTVQLQMPQTGDLPDGGKVDILPDTIPNSYAFGPRMYWSQIVGSDSAYSFAVTGANKTGRWLDSVRWVPSGPFITINGDTLSTREYARDNSGVTGDNQVLTYNGSGSLTIEDGNTVDMSDLLDNTDDQTIDTFSLSGNTLSLSLEGDGEATKTVDLSSLTTNETITLSGDVTGSGTAAITTTIAAGAVGPDELASTAVTPGSYTHASITVDADGRITAASSGTDNTGMTTFDVIGDAGTAETITDADELYLRGQFGINTSNSATDIINFEVDTSEIATQYDLTQVTSLVDSTRLTQDSILVYYQDGAEVGRDTISGVGTGGGTADNLGNHIMTQNLQTSGNWISGDGGNEGLYVDGSGNIGIGQSSPSYVLDINSTDAARLPVGTTVQRPTGADGLLRYNSDLTAFEGYYNAQWNKLSSTLADISAASTTTAKSLYTMTSGQNVEFRKSTGATQLYMKESNGNVGIGTASPLAKMHVYGNDNPTRIIIEDGSNDAEITIRSSRTVTGQNLGAYRWYSLTNSYASVSGFIQSTAGSGSGGFKFNVRNNGVEETKATIISTGVIISTNVGIGVGVPTATLHLKAGTATANTAPLKFTSGTNLTTPEAGAMEWDGTNLYITQTTGPTRKTIAYVDTDDGSASDTTDGSGDITVSHTLGSASITVTATATGTTFYHVQVHSKTSTTFKIRFYNSLGPAATSTAVTADWIAKLQ